MKGMVSKGKLEQTQWPVPPFDQQREFGAVFDAVLALAQRQEADAVAGDTLFGSLVHGAFRGELADPVSGRKARLHGAGRCDVRA
jgi:hypothetical protein